MKYKYLKGSEKDFEGAPEWASEVIESTSIYGHAFVDCFDYMCKYQSKGNPCDTGNIINPTLWKVVAKRRQITEPSWDGIGLPPVGAKVEWMSDKYGWLGGTIAAYDEKYPSIAIIRHNDGYIGCNRGEIRTEADKKRDAVIEFITGAIDSHGVDPLNSAKFIYDAIAAGKVPGVKLED